MKSVYVCICFVMMLAGFSACDSDDGQIKPAYTEEQLKWITDNEIYYQHKKDSVDADGELVYKQLVVFSDTILYRLLSEQGAVDSFPQPESTIELNLLGVLPLNNHVFVGKDGAGIDLKIRPDDEELIEGLSAVLMKTRKGEKVEAIIPHELGYGTQDDPYNKIPPCSILMFTYTVNNFNK